MVFKLFIIQMTKQSSCKFLYNFYNVANFFVSEIIKLARGEGDSQISKTTQCEQDTYEMQVRAANIGKYIAY